MASDNWSEKKQKKKKEKQKWSVPMGPFLFLVA